MQFIKNQLRVSQRDSNTNYSQTPEEKSEVNQHNGFFISRIESAKRGNYREVDVCEIIKAIIENSKRKK